jgi:tRNA(Ile)-lysidine synthetase-like protein
MPKAKSTTTPDPKKTETSSSKTTPARKTVKKVTPPSKNVSKNASTKAEVSGSPSVNAKKASPKTMTSKSVPSKAVVSPPLDLEADLTKALVLKELKSQLSQAGLLGKGRPPRVLLAYSGGGDSTALLHALAQLKETEGLECLAVYYHHNWRGTPAPELPRIHKNCQRVRIPLVLAPPHPDEEKSEMSARQFRYERLLDVATQYKAEAILTAHHEDDQLETLLFRLFRGTGPDGLEGIQRCLFFKKAQSETLCPIPILRPFLSIRQAILEAYNQSQDLPYYTDPSNANTRYARNAIRHNIVPAIEAHFPTYRKALIKLSHLVEGDVSILDHITQTQWEALALPEAPPNVFQMGSKRSTTLFCQLNVPYQRRLVRHLLQGLNIESQFEDTQRLISFLTQETPLLRAQVSPIKKLASVRPESKKPKKSPEKEFIKMSLGTTKEGDLRFLFRSDKAFWVEVHPQRNEAYRDLIRQRVAVPLSGGVVTLPWDAGQALRVEPFPKRAGMFDVRKLTQAKAKDVLVNISAYVGKTLEVRTRQAGDWIKPLGMKGKRMKLKEFFIAQRIPQELRSEWPVIACEDEILWVPAVGMSESLRVSMKSAPTHTWMLGGTEEVTQLRTLRFLEDPSTSTEEESLDTAENLEEIEGANPPDGLKDAETLMLEHEIDPDDLEVIDLDDLAETLIEAGEHS